MTDSGLPGGEPRPRPRPAPHPRPEHEHPRPVPRTTASHRAVATAGGIARPHAVVGWFVPRTQRAQGTTAAYAVVLLVTAIAALVLGTPTLTRLTAEPPTPPAPSTASAPAESPTPTHSATHAATPFRCGTASGSGGGSTPLRICIPAIRVDASVMRLGLNQDRTVQVPPLSEVRDAGWYKYSAVPGSVGPTVILGHVDSAQYGDGVFFELGRLHSGDTVEVDRADGKTATFVIDKVTEVSKNHFPSQEVYGPTAGPALRLITCGGPFDASIGSYIDNIIAWGTLRSVS